MKTLMNSLKIPSQKNIDGIKKGRFFYFNTWKSFTVKKLKFLAFALVLSVFAQYWVNVFAQGGLIDINENINRSKRDTSSIINEKLYQPYQNESIQIQSFKLRKEYEESKLNPSGVATQQQNTELEKKLFNFQKKFYSDKLNNLKEKGFIIDTTIIQIRNKVGKTSNNKVEGMYISEKLSEIQKSRASLDSIIFEISNSLKDTTKLVDGEIIFKQSETADSLLKEMQEDINKIGEIQNTNERLVSNEIKGIPALTSPFVAGFVVPSASIVASRLVSDSNSGTEWQVNLFFAGNTNQDTTSVQSTNKLVPLTKLLIPEISNFGLKVQATKTMNLNFIQGGNQQSKYIGLIGQLNFLSKSISNADSTDIGNPNINTFFIHGKVGAEIAIVPEAITVYGLLNGISSVTQVENFEKFFQKSNNVIACVETGILAYLQIPGDDKNNLVFDLGFILKNKELNSLSDDRDVLIPSIRIGYKASF